MIQRWFKGKTLAFRLTFLTIIGEAIILALFSAVVFYSSRSAMMNSFDHSVKAKAESIAALVEVEDEDEIDTEIDDDEGIEFESNNGIIPGSQIFDGSLPDEFIVTVDGEVLTRSAEKLGFSFENHNEVEPTVFQFETEKGTHFRGIILTHFRPTKTVIHTVRVGYASDLTTTDSAIFFLVQKIFGGAILCLLFSALIAWYLTRKTLEPVHDLIKQIKLIGDSFKGRRIDSGNLSPDLIPVSDSINKMIQKIEGAFDREKEFSSDAAHELRTPIASLKSSLQSSLLEMKASNSDLNLTEVSDLLEALLNDTERIEKLCEALLLLTTAHSHENNSSLSLLDWKQETLTALECVKGLSTAGKARFTILDHVETIEADRVLIDQNSAFRITENLLDNALRYGGNEISLQFTLSENKEKVILAVEDNGVGIPEKYGSKIFDRFFRVDQSRDQGTGGTGLGLSICKALAKNHGGEISYEPRDSGGSRFIWKIQILKAPLAESNRLEMNLSLKTLGKTAPLKR